MHRSLLPALLLCLAACVTVPEQEPFAVDALVPGARERVVVNQAFVLADVSASMNAGAGFAEEKALIRSFVAAMPEGSYAAAALAFGGESRRSLDLEPFERDALQGWADRVPYFGQATPFPAALAEVKRELAGQGGRAALIVFSDGLPNQHGMIRSADASLAAARTLAETHGGTVCIYTVQIGNDPEGTAFMKALAHATGCGSHERATSIADAGKLHAYERMVFLGTASGRSAPKAAAAPRAGDIDTDTDTDTDTDGDGVLDTADRCPGTPTGAGVDERGCWVIRGLNFDTDQAEIKPEFEPRLKNVADVLEQNPAVHIRVEGHTDGRGAAAYNQQLSDRRARSVADYLVTQGIGAERLQTRGLGESAPLRPNDTAENMYLNRRTELSVIE
jgi:OOP family OmpA-OmpF porin